MGDVCLMDGSAELYVELLSQIEAVLPDVAYEIRREVERGGRELELYQEPEEFVLNDEASWADEHLEPDRRGVEEVTELIRLQLPSMMRRSMSVPESSEPPQVRALSGDERVATVLEALDTLIAAVVGSESEVANSLRRWGVRSVTFGSANIDSRVHIDEAPAVSIRIGNVQQELTGLLAELRAQR